MTKIKAWVDEHLKGDPVIWAVVFALSLISILVVYSATGTLAFKHMKNPESYLLKHTILIGVGLFAMWLAHRVDYRYYSRISRLALWVSVPLLLYTFTNGVSLNDASRWISVPIIHATFQPSDLASLALITSLASMLSKRQQNIADFKESLIPILIWCGVICGLIALTNLSSAILLFLTCMLIMFIGRVPVKYLAMLVFVGTLSGVVALKFGVRGETAKSRIESFLNEDKLPFQAMQARLAVATGGVAGKGPGQSQQRNILPHPYSDFVYAIIIEEYGMVGGVVVLVLYLVLLSRGMKAVVKSERAYGGLLSAGLSFSLVLQALVNMGVVVGLGPVTGLPLPMVSMGGTSLLFTGLSLGIILSVSRGETDTSWKESSGITKNVARAA
ncbi:FtsW/RodA/SpoVE family cell cycle protein [Fulvivirga sediminis]|uniref:Probable peptidoglycan glycosyltransferase FtsW n=1 Tax=Fulvivirga sediminis TaxID=2803949 RepID=A0A937K0P2_9BACT|nr:FtsW/RodA/SpoVE family cell cycle protein [Fulvivirga sediminis]MBL3656561.1 FtsW/RodA/SpoVE family cell cycle protein [Fulvivirga sediminis]